MHDASIVVGEPQRDRGPPLLKVGFLFGVNVVPEDVNKLVPVRPGLLMVDAEGVQKFVLNGSHVHATSRVEIELLPPSFHSES